MQLSDSGWSDGVDVVTEEPGDLCAADDLWPRLSQFLRVGSAIMAGPEHLGPVARRELGLTIGGSSLEPQVDARSVRAEVRVPAFGVRVIGFGAKRPPVPERSWDRDPEVNRRLAEMMSAGAERFISKIGPA